MKVEIYPWHDGYKFTVTLGGLEVESNLYTDKRGAKYAKGHCIRGLRRWWNKTKVTDKFTSKVEQAIRESRGK